MHIRTNVELSYIHIVVLAICPLLAVMTNASQALYFILTTALCFAVSAFVCYMFNKYLSRTLKIFVIAVLSSFLVTLIDYLLTSNPESSVAGYANGVFTVIATIVLSADMVYLDTKALVNNYFIKALRALLTFVGIIVVYIFIKEPLAYGSLFENRTGSFEGFEFCRTITFALILMGIICFVAELIHRYVLERMSKTKIAYQKFVKKIRNEKVFQYDELRRKKLLVSDIEINNIDSDKADEITEKESVNEKVGEEDITGSSDETEEVDVPKKKKKNKKLKFSEETKVEKLYDKQSKEIK